MLRKMPNQTKVKLLGSRFDGLCKVLEERLKGDCGVQEIVSKSAQVERDWREYEDTYADFVEEKGLGEATVLQQEYDTRLVKMTSLVDEASAKVHQLKASKNTKEEDTVKDSLGHAKGKAEKEEMFLDMEIESLETKFAKLNPFCPRG